DRRIERDGRVTNMKRTLGRSPVAFRALMECYALEQEVIPILGERRAQLFSHAISSQTDCLVCSTYFRRLLTERGEDPDHLALDDDDRTLIEFGRRLATDAHAIDDGLYARLAALPTPAQLVAATAFGALMLATNFLNIA